MHDIWILLTRCNLMKEPLVTIQPRPLLVFLLEVEDISMVINLQTEPWLFINEKCYWK